MLHMYCGRLRWLNGRGFLFVGNFGFELELGLGFGLGLGLGLGLGF